jgi:hypothetical protein
MEDLTLPSVGASFKKWGHCTPILPKALAHSLNFPNKKIKIKKEKKKGIVRTRPGFGPSPMARCPSLNLCNFIFYSSCPPFFAHVVNSWWLAPAHARPTQTLPKNFKHP